MLWSSAACGLLLAAGYASDTWLNVGPAVSTGLYIAATIAGAILRVKDGLHTILRDRHLDINFLMILGAAGAGFLGKWEEAGVLMLLFSLSAALESYVVGKTRMAIEQLMALTPEEALVRRGGVEMRVAVAELRPGDQIVVGPGERIPADAEVIAGKTEVNESALTGEPLPVDKWPGCAVYAGTINGTGLIEATVNKEAGETVLARVVRTIEEAQGQKARAQRLTEWVDRYYTLAVIAGALLTWVLPPLLGHSTGQASFYVAMTLLVVASPCALVIAAPAAILCGIARSARAGILFKGGVHVEQAARVQIVAFDKTGTLTTGQPDVKTVAPVPGLNVDTLIQMAATAECRSEHPLARAIVRHAESRRIPYTQPDSFAAKPGLGAIAIVSGREIFVGSLRATAEHGYQIPREAEADIAVLLKAGQTVVVVLEDGTYEGLIGLADTLRPEAKGAIHQLRQVGVRKIVMLTGDHPDVAQAVARDLELDGVYAGLLPEDKLTTVRRLEQEGPVAMVGDGINDGPALAAATVGVAMGGVGSDVAMETADIILMADDLHKLPQALRLARQARRTVMQNIAFAMVVIVLLVALTFAGALALPLAVFGHEGSTILVALNALRLLVYRPKV